jgi:hypothetical protein
MTFEEVEELIEELVWTAKEVQGYLSNQFVATPEEGFQLFKKEAILIQSLKAAIKEYYEDGVEYGTEHGNFSPI